MCFGVSSIFYGCNNKSIIRNLIEPKNCMQLTMSGNLIKVQSARKMRKHHPLIIIEDSSLVFLFQLYADGAIALPSAANCELRDVITGSSAKSAPAANATVDRPDFAPPTCDDDTDDEKTEEDEDIVAVTAHDCVMGIPNAARNESPLTAVTAQSDGDNEMCSAAVVAGKFSASPRPHHMFVPPPAAAAAVPATRCIGSGGSACESVSPTRGPAPLQQPSGRRLLPIDDDDASGPDPLPGCCPPALSSMPVLPTSSAIDQLTGSGAFAECDGDPSSSSLSESSRSTKRCLEDSVEHVSVKARRHLMTDDVGACRLEYVKVRFGDFSSFVNVVRLDSFNVWTSDQERCGSGRCIDICMY